MIKKLKENKVINLILSIMLPTLVGVLVIVLWQNEVIHKILGVNSFTLPLPSRIITIIGDNIAKIWLNVKASLTVIIFGLIFGSLFGYGIALIATMFPKWGKGGLAIVATFNAIPIIALAPVIINWTKDISNDVEIRSMFAKIIVVAIVCTATMSMNAYRGFTELKPFSEDLLTSYAASKKEIFWKLRIPNSVPYIFTALKVGIPISVISTLVSEYFAEYIIGVGRQIKESISISQYSAAWAYIVVACVIGIVLYSLMMLVQGITLKNRK